MRFDDYGRPEASDRLAALLSEQGMGADEIADTVPLLQRLPDWQAPAPRPAAQQALLAALAQQSSLAAEAAASRRETMRQWLRWHAEIARRQPQLIHRSLWAGASVGICLIPCLALLRWSVFGLSQPGTVLQFFLPVIAAVSIALLYSPDADEGLEVTQATPISPRFIALCRLLALGGYEVLLGLGATGVVAYVHHLGFKELALLWLGPTALLSACSVLLSLLAGSIVASVGLCAGWLAQFVQFNRLDLAWATTPPTWGSQPAVLALATLILGVALVYLPRREQHIRDASSSASNGTA